MNNKPSTLQAKMKQIVKNIHFCSLFFKKILTMADKSGKMYAILFFSCYADPILRAVMYAFNLNIAGNGRQQGLSNA